jgi:hypothetical protein
MIHKHICEWCDHRLECLPIPEIGALLDETGHPYQCEYLSDPITPTMIFNRPGYSTELLRVMLFLPEGVLLSQQYWSEGNRLESDCALVKYWSDSYSEGFPYPFPV